MIGFGINELGLNESSWIVTPSVSAATVCRWRDDRTSRERPTVIAPKNVNPVTPAMLTLSLDRSDGLQRRIMRPPATLPGDNLAYAAGQGLRCIHAAALSRKV